MRPFPNSPWLGAAVWVSFCLAAGGAAAQGDLREAAALSAGGDFDAALREYETFLVAEPDHRLAPLAAITAANIYYLAKEDLEAAIAAYDRVLEHYPGSAWASEAARRKGECLEASERWADAGEAYGQALALAGQGAEPPSTEWVTEVSVAAANCFYEMGDRSKVVGMYEKALGQRLPPHSAAAVLYRLGDSYESDGQPEKAAEQYARVIREYPFTQTYDLAFGKRELTEQYAELDWEPYDAYAQTTADFRNRDYQAVMDRTKLVLDKSDNPILRQCAMYRRIIAETTLSGDFTRGSQRLDSLLSSLADRRMMPNAADRLAQFEGVAVLEVEASETPEDATVLRRLGEMYLRSGSSARAAEVLQKALAFSPEDDLAHLLLGYSYAQSQRADEARDAFDYYFERNPGDGATLNQVGYTYLQLGDAETAISYFQLYVEAAPDEANAHDSLGEGYLNAGRLEDAAGEYERAIEMDASFSNPYFMLAGIQRRLGQNAKAIATYEQFLEISPSGAQAEQARLAITELRGPTSGEM